MGRVYKMTDFIWIGLWFQIKDRPSTELTFEVTSSMLEVCQRQRHVKPEASIIHLVHKVDTNANIFRVNGVRKAGPKWASSVVCEVSLSHDARCTRRVCRI